MIICVTDQASMGFSFLKQFESICNGKPDQVILRAKHLDAYDYEQLAIRCLDIASKHHTRLLLHSHIHLSKKLNHLYIHLPFDQFISEYRVLDEFKIISVAVHSVREAQLAAFLGATQVVAGHVFRTDCKSSIAPRGLSFIKEISSNASIPVMAIGGITPERHKALISAGAKGVCIMSSVMNSPEPEALIRKYKAL
ncbi:thiamine phosphate synthase [Fusibacter ferrireducens]|uniref:Thiamine phosphate synthase n=1 Tax=Fusibacter ferrireducens TaxID=2785058 RepID=A0ABR9ZPS2_9FIRM|nr:thiamine phosphate synthase [Fusibacter ferrireducens]MBF4692455.1 thiamine phosphate synthase [Fusibacter ferrireducens]